jgi:bifunctional NMN adenylyltransferase/nudix hydrolase
MKVKPYRSAVVIGRFQIFHNAHKKLLNEAFTKADHVIVVLGSHRAALNIKNPFTVSEREEMIRRVYPDMDIDFVVVPDRYYNDLLWVQEVMCKVREKSTGSNTETCLCGYYKDSSSYYLDYFRDVWAFETHVSKMKISSTDIRTQYYQPNENRSWKKNIPREVAEYLSDYKNHDRTNRYSHFVEEHEYITAYKKRTQPEGYPYPIQSVTVDNIVVQNGHVLMVVRKAMPGKNLWALPGGFVNPKETLFNAALRELKEETSIKVDKSVLRRHMADRHVFDHPDRDLRGRIFSHGYFYKLENTRHLPLVKGGDDAAKAFWVPWDEIITYADRVYSDHVHILSYFLNRF